MKGERIGSLLLIVRIVPQVVHPFGKFLLLLAALRLPEVCTCQFIGHILLVYEMVGKVVGILIAVAVA